SSSTPARVPGRRCSTCTRTCSRATWRRRASLADESPTTTVTITADGVAMVQLLGPQDKLLRMVEREHPSVDVHVRGNEVTLSGSAQDVAPARALVDELLALARSGHEVDPSDVATANRVIQQSGERPSQAFGEAIVQTRGKLIRPKTTGSTST